MAKKAFSIGDELKKAGVPTVDTGREQIEYIPIEKIDPDERNFYNIGDVGELAESIEMVGLQQPLRVRGGEHGHVTVVSGHRRRAAILMLRDSGSTMFERGVPCIRERGDVSNEWQELRLIYGNSATRILTAPEISMQSEKVADLLLKLEAQGVKFPGRTRDHVAAIMQTSRSRIGRLHAIRANLVPALLEEFDKGLIGETVAYRLSQEEATVQNDLAARLGPAVRELTGDSCEKVIDQVKRPLVVKAAEPEEDAGNAIDALKKYMDERGKEDREFWNLIQSMADGLLFSSFRTEPTWNRKANIDTLRMDLRHAFVWSGEEHWSGSPKGLAIGPGEKISRTWTEVYDALAAVAIIRYREEIQRRRDGRNVKLKDVSTMDTAPEWRTGEVPREGRYLCKVDFSNGKVHECTGEYRGGSWSVFNGPLYKGMEVIAWWPLPEKER